MMKTTNKVLCMAVMGLAASLGASKAMAQSDSDKMFLMKASEGDLAEIKQSQLALDKSTNPKVKEFAQKMISDHTMLETNMKPFADKNGVMPATTLNADHQAEYDRESALSGADFDKEYIKNMDMDHHMTLQAFKMEIANTQDMDLKKTVMMGEKVVASHTKMADKLSTKMGIPVSTM